MPITCTPEDLLPLAAVMRGMSEEQRNYSNAYLLALAAGVDPDPNAILEAAKCFRCVPEQKLKEMSAYLLCVAAGGVTPPPPSDCGALSGAGDPTGVTTPEFSGQLYHRTSPDSYYRSTGTTSADWTAISGGSTRGGEKLGLFTYADSGTVGAVVITDATINPGYDIESDPGITSLSWPNLVTIDPLNTQTGYLFISGNTALTSVSAPLLQTVPAGAGLVINLCPLLTAINISSFVPENGDIFNFSGNALPAANVDAILARFVANAGFVSGNITLNGGTNSPPSSVAPGSSYAILIGRGVTVSVN